LGDVDPERPDLGVRAAGLINAAPPLCSRFAKASLIPTYTTLLYKRSVFQTLQLARYEKETPATNFGERRIYELQRIHLPGTRLNKGIKKGRGHEVSRGPTPAPSFVSYNSLS
jgi:hypothetical protein